MTTPARYLFDTDFSKADGSDEPDVTVEETAYAPVARYLAAISAAEARGYARGVSDGREEVEAVAARRLADESARLASAAQGILGALDADRVRIEKEAAEIAIVAAKRLAGHLVAREPTGEILALIDDCLGPLRQAPHIVIRVEEADADSVKAEVDRIAHERGFMGRLVVLGEPDLARGDCRIEWADGGIVRDKAAIETQISQYIEKHFAARIATLKAAGNADAPVDSGAAPPATENGQ